MANTLQAKKRVRRNAAREDINKARRSRIRTFVKKVELAVEAGNADEAKVAAIRSAPPCCPCAARHSPPRHLNN